MQLPVHFKKDRISEHIWFQNHLLNQQFYEALFGSACSFINNQIKLGNQDAFNVYNLISIF